MSYDNTKRATKSNDKRNLIVDTALDLINEKGFDNVSIEEITKAAGVSKGAFYIHFKSKEDLVERQISIFYDECKLGPEKSKYERLSYFLLESIKHIQKAGLKMCQQWFSHSVKGSFYGKSKLSYDLGSIKEIVQNDEFAQEIVSTYYGALNLWAFTDGSIVPEKIVESYLENIKERLK